MILDLFMSFLFIGAFSFGGGYAMLPLIQKEVVFNHHWLSINQFADIVAVAEMTPGPVAINMATFVGYKTAGFWGAGFATLGVVFPSFFLIVALAGIVLKNKDNYYFQGAFRGLRPVVVALVIGASVFIGRTAAVDISSGIIAVTVLLLLRLTRIHPVLLILGSGLWGVIMF